MRETHWGYFLIVAGGGVLLTAVAHFFALSSESEMSHVFLEVILFGGAGIGLVYGGYWHLTHSFRASRYPRLAGWMLAGLCLFTGVNIVSLYMGSDQVSPTELLEVAHVTSSVGAVAGLLVGTVEARAIVNSHAAAKAQAKAEVAAENQNRIDRVNEFLRHYVLNSLTVINGYTTHLATDASTEEQSKLDAVNRRIDTIATLIEHVRTLSTSLRDDTPAVDSDINSFLESTLNDVSPPQTVSIEMQTGDQSVAVTPSFERALRLLFRSLCDVIEPTESLTVSVRESDAGISLTVAMPQSAAITQTTFADAGPATEITFALAEEILTQTGQIHLGEGPDTSIACEITIERDAIDRTDSGV